MPYPVCVFSFFFKCCLTNVHIMPYYFLPQDVHATMECFENLFTRSYARADGTCPLINPQTSQLHTNALLSWALLLTICTANQLKDILRK